MLGLGCRQLAGIDDREVNPAKANAGGAGGRAGAAGGAGASGSAGGPTGCGFKYAQDSCTQCMESKCCEQEKACADAPICRNRLSCDAACERGDSACRATCVESAGAGTYQEIAAVQHCRASQCKEECSAECGDLSMVVPPSAAKECYQCLSNQCCGEATACGDSAACWGLLECTNATYIPDQVEACRLTGFPTASVQAQALAGCIQDKCLTSCGVGNWSCLGKVPWPTVDPAMSLKTTLSLVSALDVAKPVGGLSVRVCDQVGSGCQPAQTIGQNGLVTLDLTNTGSSGFGYQGVVRIGGPMDGTDYYPVNLFGNPPFTVSGITRQAIAITKTEVNMVINSLKLSVVAGRGLVAIRVLDCNGLPASGITLEFTGGAFDKDSRAIYYKNGVPSFSATETSSDGQGAFFNIKAQTFDVIAKRKDGTVVGRTLLNVEPETISEVVIAPPPDL